MKKTVQSEVDSQQVFANLVARLAAMEARLEKLDPSPKIESLEPYKLGTEVFSIIDREGRHPLIVHGYDHRAGKILVTVSPGEPERELPLASVRRLDQCPNASPTPGQAFANLDPKTREFFEGRLRSQIEAKTKPWSPPPPEQDRYGKTGTFSGGRVFYDE